jgi:hypothetical protein
LPGTKGQRWVTSVDRLPPTTSGDKRVHSVAMASSGSGGVQTKMTWAALVKSIEEETPGSPMECAEDTVDAGQDCDPESAAPADSPERKLLRLYTYKASPGLLVGGEPAPGRPFTPTPLTWPPPRTPPTPPPPPPPRT